MLALLLTLNAFAADLTARVDAAFVAYGRGDYASSWEGVWYREGAFTSRATPMGGRVAALYAPVPALRLGGGASWMSYYEDLYEGRSSGVAAELTVEGVVPTGVVRPRGGVQGGPLRYLGSPAPFGGWTAAAYAGLEVGAGPVACHLDLRGEHIRVAADTERVRGNRLTPSLGIDLHL